MYGPHNIPTLICAVICTCITVYSCKETKLEQALSMAGENRPELEKVLEHYSARTEDSLKLRAAEFLIENMPGHYSFPEDEINAYYDAVDHLLDVEYPLEAHRDSIERIAAMFPDIYSHLTEDIKIIKADYLIHNIDMAFDDWYGNRMLRHITFSQFCEYLLPYKVVDLQPLDCWRDSLRGRYSGEYHDNPWPVQMKYSVAHAANVINTAIRQKVHERPIVSETYPFLSASNIDRLPFGICDDYSFLAVAIMRSEGIPCFKEDMIWLQRATGHSWHSFINNDGNTMLFKYGLSSNSEQTFFYDTPIPKVRRHVYSRNDKAWDYHTGCTHKVFLPDLFCKDVTSEYVATSDIPVKIRDRKAQKGKWAYIAVRHYNSWEIIDFAEIRKGQAVFEDMGRSVVYLVYVHDGAGIRPLDDPFILQSDGTVEYLHPDAVQKVTVSRKYPMDAHTFIVEQRTRGARIEASDSPDFSDAVLIYELGCNDHHKFIRTNTEKEYRYWRYFSPPNSYCDIAELEFYAPGADSPIDGYAITGTLQPHPALPANTPDKAFDGNWLTNFSCALAQGAWIGVDLGKPGKIEKVRCIPRSDDNSIHTGDEYELFYCDCGEWISAGKRIGRTDTLEFSVPSGSLLLLKDHTKGEEERIFTYENGEQIWW